MKSNVKYFVTVLCFTTLSCIYLFLLQNEAVSRSERRLVKKLEPIHPDNHHINSNELQLQNGTASVSERQLIEKVIPTLLKDDHHINTTELQLRKKEEKGHIDSLKLQIKHSDLNLTQLYQFGHTKYNVSVTTNKSKEFDKINEPKNRSGNVCIIDNWMRFDSSAKSLPRHIFCDKDVNEFDVLCRWFLYQKNITNNMLCLLPKDGFKVPNIVFFITFGVYEFLLEHYLCILSAEKIQKPTAIYVIGDLSTYGHYWQKVQNDVPRLRLIYRENPQKISGSAIKWPAHAADIVRLQILLANGGIYMDTDEIFIRPMTPLRNYTITMGIVDSKTGMGNAAIIAERNSSFLNQMYENYKYFNNAKYYDNSLYAAYNLWQKNKSALHLESERLYRPAWFEDDLLFVKTGYPWRNKYAIHVWSKRDKHRMPKTMAAVDNWNTTLGEIFRYIYYGDSRLRNVVLGKM